MILVCSEHLNSLLTSFQRTAIVQFVLEALFCWSCHSQSWHIAEASVVQFAIFLTVKDSPWKTGLELVHLPNSQCNSRDMPRSRLWLGRHDPKIAWSIKSCTSTGYLSYSHHNTIMSCRHSLFQIQIRPTKVEQRCYFTAHYNKIIRIVLQ